MLLPRPAVLSAAALLTTAALLRAGAAPPPPDAGLPVDRRAAGVFHMVDAGSIPPSEIRSSLRLLADRPGDRFAIVHGELVSVRREALRRLEDADPTSPGDPRALAEAIDRGDDELASRLAGSLGLELGERREPVVTPCRLPTKSVPPPVHAAEPEVPGRGVDSTERLPAVFTHAGSLFVLRGGELFEHGGDGPLDFGGAHPRFAYGHGRHLFLAADAGTEPPDGSTDPRPIDRNDPGVGADGPVVPDRLLAGTVDGGGWRERWRFPAGEAVDAERFRILGRPVARDDRLHLIAEWDGEITLLELHASTGRLLWRQTLYHPDRPLADDAPRARIPCSPTESAGVLFCPTGTGTLVAVDRITRSLLWACRYRATDSSAVIRWRRSGNSLRGSLPLARPPVAAGDAVLIMPPDADRLLCVDRRTGEEQWNRPRDDEQFVAAVRDGVAMVVGTRRTVGLAVADGRVVWSRPLGKPAGTGFPDPVGYALPLAGGRVRVLDPATGEDAAFPGIEGCDPLRLGHLVPLGGRVVSCGAGGSLEFPAVDGVAAAAVSGGDRLAAARRELARGGVERGCGILAAAASDRSVPANRRDEAGRLLYSVLRDRLETAAGDRRDSLLAQLSGFARTDRERAEVAIAHLLGPSLDDRGRRRWAGVLAGCGSVGPIPVPGDAAHRVSPVALAEEQATHVDSPVRLAAAENGGRTRTVSAAFHRRAPRAGTAGVRIAAVDVRARDWVETPPAVSAAFTPLPATIPTDPASPFRLLELRGVASAVDLRTGVSGGAWRLGRRVRTGMSRRGAPRGGFLPVLSQTDLHGLNLRADGRHEKLWTVPLSDGTAAPSATRSFHPRLGPHTADVVLVRHGDRLECRAARDGSVVWSRHDLPARCEATSTQTAGLMGDGEVYCEFADDRCTWRTLRTHTGLSVGTGTLSLDPTCRRRAFGRRLLYFTPPARTDGEAAGAARSVRVFDAGDGRDVFEAPAGTACRSSLVTADGLVAFTAGGGEVVLYDLAAGRVLHRLPFGAAALDRVTKLSLLEDAERVFVVLGKSYVPGPDPFLRSSMTDSLPAAETVRGTAVAVDRASGRTLWSRPLTERAVMTGPLASLPYLVTVARVRRRSGSSNRRWLSVEVIDKATGGTLGAAERLPHDRLLTCTVDDRGVTLHGLQGGIVLRERPAPVRTAAAPADVDPVRPVDRIAVAPGGVVR